MKLYFNSIAVSDFVKHLKSKNFLSINIIYEKGILNVTKEFIDEHTVSELIIYLGQFSKDNNLKCEVIIEGIL